MTTARRTQLRSIMKRAHWQRRARGLSMSAALVESWAHHKALSAFYAQTAAAPAGSLRKFRIKSTFRTSGERSGRFYGNAARLSRGLYA